MMSMIRRVRKFNECSVNNALNISLNYLSIEKFKETLFYVSIKNIFNLVNNYNSYLLFRPHEPGIFILKTDHPVSRKDIKESSMNCR